MALAAHVSAGPGAKPSRVCWWIWSAYRRAAKSGDERFPEFFKATFPATDQTNNAEFKVTIQRDDLSYRLEGAKLATMLGDSTPARLAGRCSILDGRGFLTGEREGVRLCQTRRNHDKAMAAAMML